MFEIVTIKLPWIGLDFRGLLVFGLNSFLLGDLSTFFSEKRDYRILFLSCTQKFLGSLAKIPQESSLIVKFLSALAHYFLFKFGEIHKQPFNFLNNCFAFNNFVRTKYEWEFTHFMLLIFLGIVNVSMGKNLSL